MPRLSDFLSDDAAKQRLLSMAAPPRPAKRPARASAPVPTDAHIGAALLPEFVAFDLETTGLEARTDRITEIGAVRFRNGQPVETYTTVVNPGKPIPQHIVELTGITDAEVAGAPTFAEVADAMLAFIGTTPLCGHQVEFDIEFLEEELKRLGRSGLPNVYLDTALLARVALPRLPGYSLGHVAKTLNHALVSAHRAPDDALASGAIAIKLLDRLADIMPRARERMIEFAPSSLLKRILIRSLDGLSPRDFELELTPQQLPRRLPLPDEYQSIEESDVAQAFAAAGALARAVDGFTVRTAQTDMAVRVAATLNSRNFLVAEAGTGTGKSLAYLMPAAMFALHNNCRVFVSTYTRNLQDQLESKDLPLVRATVGNDLSYSVLKGRSNYLCRIRFLKLLSGQMGNLSPRERMGVLPLIRWAYETSTGDIEEQTQFSRKSFAKVWSLISAEAHLCLGRNCPGFDDCFLQQARLRALGSHIVVVNHALFFSEICAQSQFLGAVGPIIFDEAHHLEACGHQHLRTVADTNRVNALMETLGNLQRRTEKVESDQDLAKVGKTLKSLVKRLRKDSVDFMADIDVWAEKRQPGVTQFQFSYTDNPFASFASLAGFDYALKEMQDALSDTRQACQDKEGEAIEETAREAASAGEKVSQLKADLGYLCAAITDDHVFWVEGDHGKGWSKLSGVPLDIGAVLSSVWAGGTGGVVFTSATLTLGGTADYYMSRVGLIGELAARTEVRTYESPFERAQSLCLAVKPSPDPESPDYARYVAGVLADLHKTTGKNTLALFTANTMLRSVYSLLLATPGMRKSSLMAQGVSGNRNVLLEEFKKAQGAILLGTDSFWEGIDAPGEACEIVVIARLPFPVPTHPLTQAVCRKQEEKTGESFMSFSLPEATMKFRQGAGRLIRTSSDRGVLVVLDNRVVTRGYGKHFVKSLNCDTELCDSAEGLVRRVGRFFGA
jgi:predicted DnaQ family exonuclease/DinG family helicase